MRNQRVKDVMTALETAIAQTTSAHVEEDRICPWATRTLEAIDPTRWTRDIEKAIGSLDEMESLRVCFDEKALSFVSAQLQFEHAAHLVFDAYGPLSDAIRDAVVLLDEKTAVPSGSDRLLIQSLALRASAVHRKERARGPRMNDCLDDRSRAYSILVTVFKAFAGEVQRNARGARYTTDLVVPGKKYQRHLSDFVDLRQMSFSPFKDCVNSTHPANVRLEAAFKAAEEARTRARDQVKTLRDKQNGQVNERQHADRMISLLHGQVMCTGNIEQQVESQNDRRLAYESMRQQALAAIAELEECYAALVSALVEATAEADAFYESDIVNQQIVTIDKKDTIRIAMNNCLAADSYLRQLGREIEEFKNRDARDLSLGNGRLALDAAYDEIASRYRPFKSSLVEPAKE